MNAHVISRAGLGWVLNIYYCNKDKHSSFPALPLLTKVWKPFNWVMWVEATLPHWSNGVKSCSGWLLIGVYNGFGYKLYRRTLFWCCITGNTEFRATFQGHGGLSAVRTFSLFLIVFIFYVGIVLLCFVAGCISSPTFCFVLDIWSHLFQTTKTVRSTLPREVRSKVLPDLVRSQCS